MKNKKFIEPILIKAGSKSLGLGLKLTPPMCDCRVLSENNYQKLKKAYDELERLKGHADNEIVTTPLSKELNEHLDYFRKASQALKDNPSDSGLTIKDCPFPSCALNTGDGGCVSTNIVHCKEIPDQFNDDKSKENNANYLKRIDSLNHFRK